MENIDEGTETQLKECLNQSANHRVPHNALQHATGAALHTFTLLEHEFKQQ